MSNSVVISGLGIISAIGNNVEETINSFSEHRSGIGPCKYLGTVHKDIFPLAEVKLSNEQLTAMHGLEKGIIDACIAGWVELIKGSYKSFLYLVSEEAEGMNLEFSEKQILKLYNKI